MFFKLSWLMIGFLSLLLLERTECISTFHCDKCKYSSDELCHIDCKCAWCTSTAMCQRLFRDTQILDTGNDTDYFITNISEQIQHVCSTYRKDDWERHDVFSRKTCGWYIE